MWFRLRSARCRVSEMGICPSAPFLGLLSWKTPPERWLSLVLKCLSMLVRWLMTALSRLAKIRLWSTRPRCRSRREKMWKEQELERWTATTPVFTRMKATLDREGDLALMWSRIAAATKCVLLLAHRWSAVLTLCTLLQAGTLSL